MVCVSSYVSSKNLGEMMQSHIGCICLTFLHCVFSNVSSNPLPDLMQSHIGCTCLNCYRFSSLLTEDLYWHHLYSIHNLEDFDPSLKTPEAWTEEGKDLPFYHLCLSETGSFELKWILVFETERKIESESPFTLLSWLIEKG